MKVRLILAAMTLALLASPASAHPRFPWCGWFLAQRKGIHDTRLYAARNWAHWGHATAPHPGAVVVWPHHVGELVRHLGGSIWEVLSGNDGNAVRSRPRSIAGAIAFRS